MPLLKPYVVEKGVVLVMTRYDEPDYDNNDFELEKLEGDLFDLQEELLGTESDTKSLAKKNPEDTSQVLFKCAICAGADPMTVSNLRSHVDGKKHNKQLATVSASLIQCV